MQFATERERPTSLSDLLDRQAAARGAETFAVFETGERWTYAETLQEARHTAGALSDLGLGRGDVLLIWAPNGADYLRLWFGANLLGAVVAAPNIAYRGQMLDRLAGLVGAKVAAIHASLRRHLESPSIELAPTVVYFGDSSSSHGAAPVFGRRHDAGETPPLPSLRPWDTQFIMFTSGTSGHSKGVITPYAQAFETAAAHFADRLGPQDRYLINLPLFHVGGLMPVVGAMATGGSILVVDRFRTDDFWDVARRWSITACTLLGAGANFLLQQPGRPDDADNPVRWVSMLPLVKDPAAFGRRFGVNVFTAYGMSELSIPITSSPNPVDCDACGMLRPGFQARIVDDFDQPVADGGVGELTLRADEPWVISPGYWNDAEATAAAWRNGWFHTGDNFRRKPAGEYVFVDRRKDAIRRRGENISSYEVELELLAHPAIAEAAVIAAPSPFGEDDVMAVVTLQAALDPFELLEFLRPRMARFMLPRYVRIVDALPKTPSLRVQKHLLRAEGVVPGCFDCETFSPSRGADPTAGSAAW